MVVAWGLELNVSMEEVDFMMQSLFDNNLLSGLDSILEWSVSGIGFDFSECFKDENKGRWFGYIPFLRWEAKVDKISLYHVTQ